MAPSKGIPLLDAATLLVGWSNRSASRGHDKVFVSGEVVQLSTKLDASNRFSLIAAHPGHSQAVTVLLEVAPQLRDGRMGTFVGVASVAIPACRCARSGSMPPESPTMPASSARHRRRG